MSVIAYKACRICSHVFPHRTTQRDRDREREGGGGGSAGTTSSLTEL